MVQYEETVLMSMYDGNPINIEIPQGIYVYLIEIDSTNCSWGQFIDIYIMTNDDLIFYGPLGENFKQFNLSNWISKGESIRFQFRLNNKLIAKSKRWIVVNDNIIIHVKGYESIGCINYEDDWLDSNFREEWT